MVTTEYTRAIRKARKLNYTFKRIPNTGGTYETYSPEGKFICFDYELPKYFKEYNIK